MKSLNGEEVKEKKKCGSEWCMYIRMDRHTLTNTRALSPFYALRRTNPPLRRSRLREARVAVILMPPKELSIVLKLWWYFGQHVFVYVFKIA